MRGAADRFPDGFLARTSLGQEAWYGGGAIHYSPLRRILIVLLLAFLAVPPAEADSDAPPVRARFVGNFDLDGDLEEWTGEPLELGKDNLVFSGTSPLSREWAGESDLSGKIHIGFTATEILIAGKVYDDTLTLNPRVWWAGDEIEIFLDLDPDDPDEDRTVYTEDDYQILLFPLAKGRTWGITAGGGRRGQTDGGFDGVRTIARPLATGPEGEFRGYAFEAAIPLVNFPGLSIQEGREIGFDIALTDADGEFRQKTYMTLSGRKDLAVHPDRFGRLVFADPPPAPPPPGSTPGAGWLEPLVVLLGTALLIVLLRLFRHPLFRLADTPVRTKAVVLVSLLALLLAAHFLPGIARDRREEDQRRALMEKVGLLEEISREASGEWLSGTTEAGPDSLRMMNLFAGEASAPPERFEFETLWIRDPKTRVTIEHETPVIDYARSLTTGERARFEPPRPASAETVSLVVELRPDPTSRRPLEPGREIAMVRIVPETGEPVERLLRFGSEVRLPSRSTEDETPIAWRDEATGAVAEEILLPVGANADVAFVEVTQILDRGSLVVRGVTLRPAAPAAPVPLSMKTRTTTGVPTGLWQDRPSGTSLLLEPGGAPHRFPLDPRVDRVWVFYILPSFPSPYGFAQPAEEMVELTLLDARDQPIETLVLARGVHLDSEYLRSHRHPPGFEAKLAFSWTPPGDYTRHRDMVALDAGEKGAVTLTARHIGTSESVRLVGITQGRLNPHVASGDLEHLEFDAEQGAYRLRPPAAAALEGIGLTWYRDGRAERTNLEPESVRGAALPSEALWGEPEVGRRRLGGRQLLAVFLRLDERGRDVLEASLPLPDAAELAETAQVVFFALLALLLLGVLLILADLLARLSRLRVKLTLGFAIATLVPLLLFFFGMSGTLEREMSRTERDSLLEQVRLVGAKIKDMQSEVRLRAHLLLRDSRLLEAISHEDGKVYAERTDALIREMSATASPFLGPARVTLQDVFPIEGDRSPRVFPSGSEDHPFLGAWSPGNDIVYRWSTLTLEATTATKVSGGHRRIAIEAPVDEDLLTELRDRFGRRFDLALFTLRGFPLASTLVMADESAADAMERRRKIRDEIERNRAPVVRTERLAGAPCAVAYDLLRASKGDPVALIAVALPHQELVAAQAEVRHLFLLLGAVILILEVIVGNIMMRRVTDPLTSLSRGARAVARGHLTTRVRVDASDEIGALAGSFNRMTAELGRRIEELSRLNAASRTFGRSLDREKVLEHAVRAFRETTPPPDALLIALECESGVEIAAGFSGPDPVPAVRLPAEEGLIAACLRLDAPETLFPAPALISSEADLLPAPAAVAVVPFGREQAVRGAVILAYADLGSPVEKEGLEFLSTMVRQVAVALENARLYQLAIEDQGTGSYVHSYFLSRLREETDRALAGDRPLSVVLTSLPEVDAIYESHGDEAGDRMMAEAVRRIRSAARGMHIVARADRATLEILLPEADKEHAFAAAQEVRDALTRSALTLEGDPGISVRLAPSIGLASCPEDARSAAFLLSEARGALYKAVTDRAGDEVADTSLERERLVRNLGGTGVRFIFRSEKILELLETVDRIATSDVSILVQGETGVGKEVLAELVHEKSRRCTQPLLKVNCAAIPETLLESELFGHERGAFTGADRRKAGRFELAHGGTIFLDEVGEMPTHVQVKLLRVLQDHKVERLGSTAPVQVDVRVIAATNRDLLSAIRAGLFREDLYYRLNVVSLVIPPLRARKEDIPVLTDHFIEQYRKTHETTARGLSPDALDRLFTHTWPGNVRELRNCLHRALVIARGEEIHPEEIVFADPSPLVDAPAAEPLTTTPPTRRRRRPPVKDTQGLSSRQLRLLQILSRRDTITNRAYSNLEGISPRTGNRDLKELIARGLIEQVGRRRAAVYRLAGETPG